jgi:hypothetical protein
MQGSIRPYVTTGIAIVGASLIAVTPVAPPTPNPQQRALKLVDYTEYDASQLASATDANWSGLETILSSSNWTTDPDISQGLSTLFSDLSTGTSNAVTNPLSELTEGALALFSGDYGFNAASTAFTAVTDNIESALSSGDYSLALTDFENEGTTVLYAFLNGYPDSVGSGLISPEFGLLTNTTDGAATGQIDALAQISNTIADEVANLGGANLTTGSLPLVTGNLDLSVNLDQILSDLGLTSGGSALTINGLLGDLGISPTSDILPTLTIGDVLSDLKLTDSSGLSLTQILEDLNIVTPANPDPTFSIDSILGDLGVNTSNGISIQSILEDLNIVTPANPDPTFSIDSILGDLGVNTSNGISVDDILSDLSVNTSSSFSLGTILGDLGVNTNATLSLDSIVSAAFPGNISLSSLITGLIGSNPSYLGISLSSFLNDIHVGSDSISADQILSALGLGNSSISLNTILGDLGLNGSYSVNSILSILGINGSATDSFNTILTDLGIGGSYSLDSLLSALGIDATSTDSFNTILTDLGIGGSYSLDSLLSALGIDATSTDSFNTILTDLGIGGSYSLDSLLSALGINASSTINLGDVLGYFGLSDSSTIPLPSFSIDGILGDLGINPDENILTLLGISDPLSLNPSIDLGGGAVATYADDLAKDLLAALGSIEPASADLPSLLTTEPAVDLTNLLSGLLTGLDVPVSVSGNLSLDLTSVVAELVPSLF